MEGPLTCLWADMADKNVVVNPQVVMLLIQRVLVFLGSAFYSNKKGKGPCQGSTSHSLMQEDTKEDKEDNTLLSSGFLERAVKGWRKSALAKVTGTRSTRPGGNALKCQGDPNSLRCFLERGGLARYSGRNSQCHRLYS